MNIIVWNIQYEENGFGSSKVRVVVKWESEWLFILGSFQWGPYTMEVIDPKVNNPLLSHFITTLEDPRLKKTAGFEKREPKGA